MPVLDFSLAPNESVISEAGALFFFQAEDGIQDTSVTGVQTCALPIFGILIESAHSLLLGIDASDDMAFAMALGKLWGVHLNDQDGLKYDQDKSFGAVNIRRAFNRSEERRVGKECRSRWSPAQ